jgi:hypothetical protein
MIEFIYDEQGVSILELGIVVVMFTTLVVGAGILFYVLYCLGVACGVL